MVFSDYFVIGVQVGDRARDSTHTMQTATTQPTRLEFAPQHRTSSRCERGCDIELVDGECRIHGALSRDGSSTRAGDAITHVG
jgi:hypothetical protein